MRKKKNELNNKSTYKGRANTHKNESKKLKLYSRYKVKQIQFISVQKNKEKIELIFVFFFTWFYIKSENIQYYYIIRD